MTLDWISPAVRLQSLPQYVFARLDELKASARSQGIDLIDLGMGNPDGDVPPPQAKFIELMVQIGFVLLVDGQLIKSFPQKNDTAIEA